MAAFLTIAFDRGLLMWLLEYVTLCIDCQTPVTPLMRGYTLCDLSAPQSVPWTQPKKLRNAPLRTSVRSG